MQQEDTVVIDARNDYEYSLGHFRNAIMPDIKHLMNLPEWIRENKQQFLKAKKSLLIVREELGVKNFQVGY